MLPEYPPDGTVVDPCDIPYGVAIFSIGEGAKDMWFYLWRRLFEDKIRGICGIEFELLKNDAKKKEKQREEEKRCVRRASKSIYLIIVPSSRIFQGQNNTNMQGCSMSSSEHSRSMFLSEPSMEN